VAPLDKSVFERKRARESRRAGDSARTSHMCNQDEPMDAPGALFMRPGFLRSNRTLSSPAGPKIVSGSRYTRRPWGARPAHEATTRVPFGPMARPRDQGTSYPAGWPPQRLCGWLPLRERAFAAQCRRFMDQWVGASFIVTARTPVGPIRGETRPWIAVPIGPLRNAGPNQGENALVPVVVVTSAAAGPNRPSSPHRDSRRSRRYSCWCR
jgi:hypothetical protein